MAQWISHRGESLDAPENTLAAFQLAMERNSDGMETDVRITSDGFLVCSHDADTRRMGGVACPVAETTFAELRGIDVSGGMEAFRGETIPLLTEALRTLRPGKLFFIEVKVTDERALQLMKDAIEETDVPWNQIYMISFHEEIVRLSRKYMPEVKTLWLCGDDIAPEALLKKLHELDADGVDIHYGDMVTRDFIDMMHADHMEVAIWTVDDDALCRRFYDCGVDAVTSNRAAAAMRNVMAL